MSFENSTSINIKCNAASPANEQSSKANDKQAATDFSLDEETLHRTVELSVSTIVLECGYQLAKQSSIDILTDVCCNYIQRIASLLRFTYDTADLRDSDGDFFDNLDRVFHQINIPSVANLHQFVCKIQVIKKHLQAKQHQQEQQKYPQKSQSLSQNQHQYQQQHQQQPQQHHQVDVLNSCNSSSLNNTSDYDNQ